jgi:hypothetical protein
MAARLPVELTGPVDDREKSDDCGVRVSGAEREAFWKDRMRVAVLRFCHPRESGDPGLVGVFGGWEATVE